ncbi:CDP-glycerol glycerophosphotransferase family protein [Cytobacillus sp. FSL R5-0596]|uniref:CDP-glycerol glycerophosphotransferase family protein n=1 Tax=Cytobacillus sp. FSL R5-0596 TaxID=2954696 RepID=UPI0030F4C735
MQRKKVFKIDIVRFIKKARRSMVKTTKEYIINNLFSYGELVRIHESDEKVILSIRVKRTLVKNDQAISIVLTDSKNEIEFTQKGILTETLDKSYVFQFEIQKQRLKLTESKRKFFLFIKTANKQYHVRFIENYDEHQSIFFFENKDNLFFIRRDRHERIFFRAGCYSDLNTVFDIPNFINGLYFNNGKLEIAGEIYRDSFSEHFKDGDYFFTLKNKKGVVVQAPLKIEGNHFTAGITIDKDMLLPKGYWNMYIKYVLEETVRYFPCYVKRDMEPQLQQTIHVPSYIEAVNISVSIFNGKIYAKSSYDAVEPQKLNIKENDGKFQVKMAFNRYQLFRDYDIKQDEVYLRFRQRDTNEYFSFPVSLMEENNTILLESVIDPEDFNLGPIDRPRRWDTYISFEKQDAFYNFRIRANRHAVSERNTKVTSYGERDRYYCAFYRTKYKRLSFVYSQSRLTKYINDYSVTEEHFTLKGIAYLAEDTDKRLNDYTVSLMLVNRSTENHLAYQVSLSEDKRFKVEIPIHELQELVNEFKEIVDFYLLFEGEHLNRRVKIGLKKFEYYKDDVLIDFTSTLNTGDVIEYNLTLTPKGNFKFESFKYDSQSYEQIQKASNENSKEDIWLIGERPDTAQDNGLRFFEYCREKFPELEIYYAINADSPDKEKVESLGNTLLIGSREHIEKSIKATKFIGTHDLDYILPFKGIKLKSYRDAQKIFLQHGVLGRKNVPYNKGYYKYPFDLFIVSSEAEKSLVVKKFGYDEDEVVVTGLARFDKLQQNHFPKREILLIPTWREWIVNEEKLINSNYFKKYIGFIKSERLKTLLETHDLKLNFYPHYRMQDYIVQNVDIDNERIRLVKLGEKNVQDLIKENSLMITDFSSVSFDFTYLAKPVIYYHFDQDQFFSTGILRPIEETFLGDIVSTSEDLVDKIEDVVLRNFKEREDIAARKDLIFSVVDTHNNDRIMDEILKRQG